jgi:putative nucleotidyltransferase with HDIG domain
MGGEEFALVLPTCGEHEAYVLAARLRRAMAEEFADFPVPLTVSSGITATGRHGDTARDLLRNADRALYAAKAFGRDRAVVYRPETADDVLASPDLRVDEQLSAVLLLAETLDLRDDATAQHSATVGRYAEMTARSLGLPSRRVERIRVAGILHDLGKVGVADAILRKAGPLDDAEWAEMRRHPELGARILANARLVDVSSWVLAHHERIDGQGYPEGLSGSRIPVEARILAVADAFEAMTAERPYGEAMTRDAAVAELRACTGTQFDGEVVEAFIAALSELEPLTTTPRLAA